MQKDAAEESKSYGKLKPGTEEVNEKERKNLHKDFGCVHMLFHANGMKKIDEKNCSGVVGKLWARKSIEHGGQFESG